MTWIRVTRSVALSSVLKPLSGTPESFVPLRPWNVQLFDYKTEDFVHELEVLTSLMDKGRFSDGEMGGCE